MRFSIILSACCCILITVFAGPVPNVEIATVPSSRSLQVRKESACDRVNKFADPTTKDWLDHKMDERFITWLGKHKNAGHFQSTWGNWAFGNPNWNCLDGGTGSCNLPECDNAKMAEKSDDDLRFAYYITLSLINLRAYFKGVTDAMTQAGIYSALAKDKWARDFWHEDDHSGVTLAVLFITIAAIVAAMALTFINPAMIAISSSLGGAAAGAAGAAAGTAGAAAGTAGAAAAGAAAAPAAGLGSMAGYGMGTAALLSTTVPGAMMPYVNKPIKELNFDHAADVGNNLAHSFRDISQIIRDSNNELFKGSGYNQAKALQASLPEMLALGAFIDFEGINIGKVSDSMSTWMQGNAINQIWRTQKVFIVGGGSCDDADGFGQGPPEAKLCRDDQAWYLYHWEEKDALGNSKHPVGLMAPHGMEFLGTKDYPDITVQDIISSSLDSYQRSRFSYTEEDLKDSISEAIQNNNRDPFLHSARWEGLFTIPVCDISARVYNGVDKWQSHVLQKYGKGHHLTWCGAVCDNDVDTTLAFLAASGFKDNGHDNGYFVDKCSAAGAAHPIESDWD